MISEYIVEFTIFSFIGWIYECIYGIITTKHWDNRGFLFGPICPIYGSALVSARLVLRLLQIMGIGDLNIVALFFLCMFGTAGIEYFTSFVLEKLFHAVWWDYGNMPLNINGRVCLPASVAFGLAGVVVLRRLLPFLSAVSAGIPTVVFEILALVFVAMLSSDITITVVSLTRLLPKLEQMQEEFDRRMESGVERVQTAPAAAISKITTTGRDSVMNAADRMRELKSKFTRIEVRQIMNIYIRNNEKSKHYLSRLKEMLRKN